MKIAIIGAGVAGISMMRAIATHYHSNNYNLNIEVVIFEGREIGGVAYQSKSEACLLNLPAGIMSIDVATPDHFKNWLDQKGILEHSIPRYIYGQYLKDCYLDLISSVDEKLSFKEIREDVKSIIQKNKKFEVNSDSGLYSFDKVVLCVGHSEPTQLFQLDNHKNYINNPWEFDFGKIDQQASIAIIGSRLTALDISKLMIYNGHKGQISLCSRTAKLPQVKSLVSSSITLKHFRLELLESMKCHNGYIELNKIIDLLSLELFEANFTEELFKKDNRSSLSFLSLQLQKAKSPRPEQEVIGELYQSKIIDYIWHHLSPEDKLYFNKHYASQWMSFAHPIPFENGIFLRDAIASKAINTYSGLYNIEEHDNQYKIIADSVLYSDYVVNCSGMSKSASDHRSGLLLSMMNNQFIKGKPLERLELDYLNFKILAPSGNTISGFYANGAITSGVFFSAFAAIHAVRDSFSITQNIFNELNLDTRNSA